MPDIILTVSLEENEWRLINNCMEYVRDNVDLCSDCMSDLFEIHEKMVDQILDQLKDERNDLS